MITGKVNWEAIRPVIEQETGPARIVKEISEGRNSEISVIVHTDADVIFVKGRKASHPQAWTQEREKVVNPSVLHLSPWLKWSISSDEWNLLGFEFLPGRHVDYSPGSPDVPKVMDTLVQLQQISCPNITLKHAEQRWATYTDTPELFAGTYLLHTDWSPGNVLVNGRAYLVDWAWPTKGAGWIDPACLAVWLIACGHSPASAESWAARIPSWKSASGNALNEFARVQALMWADIAADSSEPWTGDLAQAAQLWAKHRSR